MKTRDRNLCRLFLPGLLLAAGFVLLSAWAHAQTAPQGITYHGRLLKPDGEALEDSSVTFTIQIRSPGAEDCALYEETHTVNMTGSEGIFNLTIGAGLRAGGNFKDTSSLRQAFDNSAGVINALQCASGTSFTPANGDRRKLAVSFTDNAGTHTIAQNQTIQAVPYALYADTLQGKSPGDFISRNSASAVLTQTNLESIFATSANVTELLALINGTSTNFTRSNGANFTPVAPVSFNTQRITNLADPTAAQDAATRNYTDTKIGSKDIDLSGIGSGTGDGRVLSWDATNNRWITTASSTTDNTKLPLTGGTMSGAINMDGQNLTNAGYITMNSNRYLGLGAYTDANETTLITGTLTPGGNTYKGVTWFNSTSNTIKYWNGASAIAVATGSTAISSLNGSTAATQTFATPGTTGTAPGWSTDAATGVHTLNIPMAADVGVNAGLISKAQYDIFNAKLGPTLNSAQILVGSNLNVATAVSPTGDVTLSNTGVFGVTKVQGHSFSSTTPQDGQVYVWNNAGAGQWQPKNFSIGDLKTSAGASQFASANCADHQTLTWNGVTDAFTCVDINIADTAVTYTNRAANLVFAGPTNGAAAAPTFRSLVAADLPAGIASQWTTATNDIYYNSGNVGIGTNGATAKLEVAGQARSVSSTGSSHDNTSAAVNWNNGNTQSISVSCAATTMTNMLDGATYVLAVTETGTSQCNFTQAGLTFYYSPANGARLSGLRTVYTFQRIGSAVYVSWIRGFQP